MRGGAILSPIYRMGLVARARIDRRGTGYKYYFFLFRLQHMSTSILHQRHAKVPVLSRLVCDINLLYLFDT
jgi:hypothetical protein